MQIYYNQLDSKLRDNLKPIYVIAGMKLPRRNMRRKDT